MFYKTNKKKFYKTNKKKNCTSVLESKQNNLKVINSAKHSLDLKRIHEIFPEKHYRQEYNTNIWSEVFQKYHSWKKKPNKKKVLKFYESYRKQQHIQQGLVKQTAKKEINNADKENVEKKKEKSIETDNQENHSGTSQRMTVK